MLKVFVFPDVSIKILVVHQTTGPQEKSIPSKFSKLINLTDSKSLNGFIHIFFEIPGTVVTYLIFFDR